MNLSDPMQQLASADNVQDYPRSTPRTEALADLNLVAEQTGESQPLMLSGLWLLHGFLDESHSISQDSHTPTGSFWHAIMHRLEGDFWNSKYWYQRVGTHEAYEAIEQGLSNIEGASEYFPNQRWDPEVFVDLCENAANDPSLLELSNQLARLEWKCLFDCCNG